MKPDKASSRPIRAVGLLLILQAIGLVGLIAYGLLQVDWQQVRSDSQQQEGEEESGLEAARAIGAAILLKLIVRLVSATEGNPG